MKPAHPVLPNPYLPVAESYREGRTPSVDGRALPRLTRFDLFLHMRRLPYADQTLLGAACLRLRVLDLKGLQFMLSMVR